MLLADTIIFRPYVFVFFLMYCIGCSLHLGVRRMILFGVFGYLIAWLSELSSIHYGFPYGYYYYLDYTKGKEIWVLGIPFMDSISYVFLAYASYSLALLVISPVRRVKWIVYVLETKELRSSYFATFLGTIFFVYLDIVIDPVALKGSKWFLGQIYGYADHGVYFGVPISNFAGWFVTGFLMITTLQAIDRYLQRRNVSDYLGYRYPWRYLVGPVLYFGVLVFNISISFLIHEHTLGWVGVFIITLLAFFVYSTLRTKFAYGNIASAQEAHLRDFPQAQ